MRTMRALALADRPFHADARALAAQHDLEATYSQRRAAKLIRKLPPADVLICHCPPYGVNDDPDDPAHVGFVALREWVLEHRPQLLLHGHTHPNPGALVERLGDTRIVYVNGARVVDLDPARPTASGGTREP